jgi:hypothetical protein
MDIKVKNAQEEMQRLLDKIMKHKEDMIDVIDTWRYIKESGLAKYFDKKLVYDSSHVKMIGVSILTSTTGEEKGAYIKMRFNNWKNEKSGPYDWYVSFDGQDVKIYINDKSEIARVKDMISTAAYDKQENRVIMPILNKYGWYTNHEYTKPMAALAAFAERIEPFITAFFEEAKNITLKL